MNTDDLEQFEAERELQLAQEYQDVVNLFKFAVETDRRFYLANKVDVKVIAEGVETEGQRQFLRIGKQFVQRLGTANRMIHLMMLPLGHLRCTERVTMVFYTIGSQYVSHPF